MNKILKLFDAAFVLDLFRREVLPLYPDFSEISAVRIRPYKKLVWESTYHTVIKFSTVCRDHSGREIIIPIVCSAHSEEPRENIFLALKYLWAKNFLTDNFRLPRPLFYSDYFRATFYRALSGENLLCYIKQGDRQTVDKVVRLTAAFLAKLHSLPVGPEADFNPANARLRTVVPGVEHILREMSVRYDNKYNADLEKIYARLDAAEEKFFASGRPLALIHGDAHPENIILTSPDSIGVIDFTDLCRADYARDLGTFMQQLEYKVTTKIGDLDYARQAKQMFLEAYLAASGRVPEADLPERLDLYYNWTTIRTAIFWFLKFGHNEERAARLLAAAKERLGL